MRSIREALRSLPDAVFADLLESADAYLLVLDLPGVTAEGVDLEVGEHHLELSARREKHVPEGFEYRDEGRSLFLDATIPLPADALPGEATATMESGVLEVTLPKAATRTREIPIEG
ncbi:MAG: Hsp20/alpha crystallin family protein [Halodesulfurarchaeum sp.]